MLAASHVLFKDYKAKKILKSIFCPNQQEIRLVKMFYLMIPSQRDAG